MLAVVSMLDFGILDVIGGPNVDRPRSAITLTGELHGYWKNFEVFFSASVRPDDPPHTYKMETILPPSVVGGFPKTRTLFQGGAIEAPLPRLFALHRAIALILFMSGAGEFIDGLLLSQQGEVARGDGSTALDRFVRLRLRGWTRAADV